MEQRPLKKGYMNSCPKVQKEDPSQGWQKKYYVLFPPSQNSEARLDWFNDEHSFERSPSVRKTIFIEEIKNIDKYNFDGHSNCFKIETLRRTDPFLYSASSKAERKEWVGHMKKLVDQRRRETPQKQPMGGESYLGEGVYHNQVFTHDEVSEDFQVVIGATPSASHCNLHQKTHILQLYSQCMVLQDQKTKETLFVWPYKFIRRYGRSSNSFTFEAGRRCATGEGVFVLLTTEAEQIFQKIQEGNNVLQEPPIASAATAVAAGAAAAGYQRLQELDSRSNNYTRTPSGRSSQFRERTNSSSSSEGPPLPNTARPPRAVQPLPSTPTAALSQPKVPMVENYSDPLTTYDDETEMYSSIEDEEKVRTMIKESDYGYSDPVTNTGAGMSSIAGQVRNRSQQQRVQGGEDYDVVTLNPLKRPTIHSNPGPESENYGKLYVPTNLPNAIKKDPDENPYSVANN